MAQIFAGFLGGTALTAFWYHFAIMFEALFILTTVDAGTRVGRFMIQDMIGNIWRPFARTSWLPGNIIASASIVAAWGYFLYAGVTDPLGGINQLFPLFGIANQLLAAVALTVGTTILIKMGKLKWAWVTALPLTWDAVVTLTASWYKIFSPEPRIGFFTQFADARASLAAGEVSPVMQALGAQSLEDVNQVWWNTLIDGSPCVLFAVMIIIVIADAARVWIGIIRGRKEPVMSEAPYEESHLDVDDGVLDTRRRGNGRFGPRCLSCHDRSGRPEATQGDLRRECLRPLPGGPRKNPLRQAFHDPGWVLPLAPGREVQQPRLPLSVMTP